MNPKLNPASENGYVYLDWAATAPLCEQAAEAMVPYLTPGPANIAFGANANSLHTPGRCAFTALEDARAAVASALGSNRPDEVIFTSGATEADNAALFGLIRAAAQRHRQKGEAGFTPHLITTSIEHGAIASALPVLRSYGCEITLVHPDANGFIRVDDIADALQDNTVLVSLMSANNEVGSIQRIADAARCAHEGGALLHTDATQAFGKIPFDVKRLGVDAASVSAHKIGGPKGIGALYLKARTPFLPFMLGGGQENGLRSGTQNVCGAVGFAAAAEAVTEDIEAESARQRHLRDALYERLCLHPNVEATIAVPQDSSEYLPNIVNVCVPGFESETLILRLDVAGFAVSGGSACSSHSLEPSKVLLELGLPKEKALCSLRISFGRYIDANDLDRFTQALFGAIDHS